MAELSSAGFKTFSVGNNKIGFEWIGITQNYFREKFEIKQFSPPPKIFSLSQSSRDGKSLGYYH